MSVGVLSGTAKDGTTIEIVFEAYHIGSSDDNSKPTLRVMTFDDFKRGSSARWATHEIIQQKSILEFIGPGLEELSFSVLLHAGLGVKPKEELKKLRQIRDEGIICLLMIGDEQVTDNKVVLQKMDEDPRTFDGTGEMLVVAVNLSFTEYPESEA